jgi:hypothetical protein
MNLGRIREPSLIYFRTPLTAQRPVHEPGRHPTKSRLDGSHAFSGSQKVVCLAIWCGTSSREGGHVRPLFPPSRVLKRIFFKLSVRSRKPSTPPHSSRETLQKNEQCGLIFIKVLCQFDESRVPLLFQNNLMLWRSHPIGLFLPFSTTVHSGKYSA